MPDIKKYDVIVIGAGPAGSMAARYAAEGGAKTLLLEKHESIGLPVCCAEGITDAGLRNYVEPRPEWIATYISRASLVGPSGKTITVTHENAGFILHRDKFDNYLTQMAKDSGAEVETYSPVVSLNIRDQIIKSVVVENSSHRVEYEADIFIAADGVESRIAMMAGIATNAELTQIDTTCQYYADNLTIDDDKVDIYIGNNIAPGGYIWVFPKSATSANIGAAIWPPRLDGKFAKNYLDDFIDNHFPGHKKVRLTMGGLPEFKSDIPRVQGNLMLIGDAARILDSLSGAGISNAMISGKIAGETAAKSLGNIPNLREYFKEFMKLKSKELHAYKVLKSLLVKATDNDFNIIVDALDDLFPE